MRTRKFLALAVVLVVRCGDGDPSTSLRALSLPKGIAATGRAEEPPAIPQINLNHFLPVIRQQVREAYDTARARPRDAEANGELGMVLDTYEQYTSAAICYQRAHRLDPRSFKWLYGLGWVEAAQGDFERAVRTLKAALDINPDYLPAQLKLAETLLSAGKVEESGQLYETIVKKNPDLATAHYGLGRAYATQEKSAQASAHYEKACELFPAYGAAHYALALEYRKLGEAEKAKEHFRLYEKNMTTAEPLDDPLRAEVRQLNRSATNYVRRGVDLEQAGRLEDAIREHEKALKIDPTQVQAHVNLLILYGRLGQFDKAEEHFRTAAKLNPNQADPYYNYGVMMFNQRKYTEAEQAFQRALEINPFYAEAYNNLGFLREQQGRLEEALRLFEKAVEQRPDFRLAHFHIGRILVNEKKYDEAIRHFLRTLEPEDESTPGYLYALAAAYARAGDRGQATAYARKARDAARARGQAQLLKEIERDLHTLEEDRRQ